ncbi:MAG: TMEM198/TM7SF3 family protein [Clostridiales bacterium]|nr:TMEM198/TM7SF3 family protein [Clostridiales bacterium]
MSGLTEILMRVMNIVNRVSNMEQLNTILVLGYGVLCIFGILNCILGYRLLRFWVMIFGFAMGAALGLTGVYLYGGGSQNLYIAAAVAGGAVMAIFSFLIYRAGLFVIGLGIGMALSIYAIQPRTSFSFFLCILLGVGLGVLALHFSRVVIIVGTSVLGGGMAGISLARLAGMDDFPYGVLFSVVIALLGMLIQFGINPGEEDEEDEEGRGRVGKKKSREKVSLFGSEDEDVDFDYEKFYYGDEKPKKDKKQSRGKSTEKDRRSGRRSERGAAGRKGRTGQRGSASGRESGKLSGYDDLSDSGEMNVPYDACESNSYEEESYNPTDTVKREGEPEDEYEIQKRLGEEVRAMRREKNGKRG